MLNKPIIINKKEDKYKTILFYPFKRAKNHGGVRVTNKFKKTDNIRPLLTIITVVKNGANTLEKCIKSVIDQNKLMTHFCPGICVFFTADLYGGGIRLENDYIKFVKERYGQVESLFEWCAGPGYLGYSMLAHGITKKLCLADINPKAVQYANKTCKENLLGKDGSKILPSLALHHE